MVPLRRPRFHRAAPGFPALAPLLALLMGSFHVAAVQAQTYTISSRVTGAGGPLPNVDVMFDCCATAWSVKTDKNGAYSFTTQGPQTGSVIVAPTLGSGLGQASKLLQVDRNITDADFKLEPGLMLAGLVRNKSGIPGDPFTASLEVGISHPNVDSRFHGGDYRLSAILNFERFFDGDGRHHARVLLGSAVHVSQGESHVA